MALTRPIPKAAMPVVEILRRDVSRPKRLPVPYDLAGHLRFTDNCRCRSVGQPLICPMGLHGKATNRTPIDREDLPLCSTGAIKAFYRWWDEQTDAKAATDAVWPRTTKRAAK